MKNLEEFGVQEMNSKELKETDGGIGVIEVALLASAAYFLGRKIGGLFRRKEK
jgi:lactobin A/cerein 7B family class IIb bacteriocin